MVHFNGKNEEGLFVVFYSDILTAVLYVFNINVQPFPGSATVQNNTISILSLFVVESESNSVFMVITFTL